MFTELCHTTICFHNAVCYIAWMNMLTQLGSEELHNSFFLLKEMIDALSNIFFCECGFMQVTTTQNH